MSDDRLKHYKTYLQRLHLFSKAIGVKIVIVENDDDGVWLPWTRTVKINDDLSQAAEIATILHELGHALDDILTPSARSASKMYKAYRAIYRNKYTKKQLALVLQAEKKAWRYGRDIADRLGIRLGKWYDKEEIESIKAYKDI
jgi:hypothetical protein